MADDGGGVGDSGHPEVRADRDALIAGRDAMYVARDAYITYVLPPEQPGTAELTQPERCRRT